METKCYCGAYGESFVQSSELDEHLYSKEEYIEGDEPNKILSTEEINQILLNGHLDKKRRLK